MTKERLKSPRARLFVALDLPDEVRAGLAEWQSGALAKLDALRPIRREALHLTLCFIGYQPEREIERIAAIVTALAPRPVELRFEPALRPVPPSRPRLFAAGARSPAAIELADEVSRELEAARYYEPEARPFWPHVTVARVRPEKGSRRPRRLAEPPAALPDALLEPFGAVRVTLYRSILRPTGAEYAPLAVLELPPPAGKR